MSLVGFKARNHPQQTVKPHVDDRGTDPALFAQLHERFHFTVDVAASDANAKLPRYYTIETDGLAQSWYGERVWCNPPYSNIRPWVEKANSLALDGLLPFLVVMLVPANRTEQAWWQDLIEPERDSLNGWVRTEFLRGRQRFVAPGAEAIGPNERPPFGCVLLIWDGSDPYENV